MGKGSLLQRIASEEVLWTAWDEVRLARGAPGVDGVSVKAFARDAAAEIRRLAEEIPERRYRSRPLRRVWMRKHGKEDEFRPLAIPAVRDRVAAGAAHQVLEHVFEPRYHDSSFGFRRGRGTLAALRRLLWMRDQGATRRVQAFPGGRSARGRFFPGPLETRASTGCLRGGVEEPSPMMRGPQVVHVRRLEDRTVVDVEGLSRR